MSGKVPPSSRAGQRGNARNATQRAALLYERFTGHDAADHISVTVPDLPKSVAVIGPCDAVQYTTIRDGVTEKYIHKFRANDRPLLCVSPDGRQLLFVGGDYVFTERGIVDRSDRKNLPRRFRR